MAILSSGAGNILVHGHRGARTVLPENTLPAFQYAIQVGADALELDLAVTRDNVLVVSHDLVLDPRICQGPAGSRVIRELTLAELRRWDCGGRRHPEFPKQRAIPRTPVPTFEEVLALAPRGGFDFNVETKLSASRPEYAPPPGEFARLVYESVRARGLERRVILQSFDFRTLHAMEKLAPEVRRSALFQQGSSDFVAVAREARATIVSPHLSLVTAERVKAAHNAGLQVVPWTANEPAQWDALIAAGVDAIITDDPEALLSYLRARALHR